MKVGDVFRRDARAIMWRNGDPRPEEITQYKVKHIGKDTVSFEVRENDGRGPRQEMVVYPFVAGFIERDALPPRDGLRGGVEC